MTQLFETGRASGAIFSPCRIWRYQLWRCWDASLPTVLFVGLNPSTADETKDDPTIRKCIKFAKRWGYGTYLMCNMFGYRSTDPRGLDGLADPTGPENDWYIAEAVSRAAICVAAWGSDKLTQRRAVTVCSLLKNPYCLRLSKDGNPWHPLYIPDDTDPIEYRIKPPGHQPPDLAGVLAGISNKGDCE